MGHKDVVHQLLFWLLANAPVLKKRAFLAHFCVNLEIPDDYLHDDVIYELFQQYKELQSTFKTTHQHLETKRGGKAHGSNLQELQRELVTFRIISWNLAF